MHVVLVGLFVFWMLLFAVCRIFFLSINYGLLLPSEQRVSDVVRCFWQSFSLDASMAAYLLVIPWMILALSGPRLSSWVTPVLRGYVFLFTVFVCWVAISDAFVYPEWKQKLNARVLTTLAHPSEILRIASWTDLLVGHLWWAGISACAYTGFLRWHKLLGKMTDPHRMKAVLLVLAWPVILGVVARGGTKAIAIDVSRAYYSTDPTLNDAAINPTNYFIRNVMQSRLHMFGANIFASMPQDEALRIQEHLSGKPTAKPTKILKDGPVNLVFIVLESWSADLIASLGGRQEIAPHFADLEKEGLLFTRFYANGNRSQQGIASIFGGFPALPRSTLTEDPAKARKLPGLARRLSQAGYGTSFLYGGQLEYGNIRSFVVDSGFDFIMEDKDFPPSLPRANLGVIDGEMFKVLHAHLNAQKSPFFASYFTLSSHAPYDIPDQDRYLFEGVEAPYVRSAMYADEAMGRFFDAVRQEAWFEQTLFVIVADHSHNSYFNRSSHDAAYRRIPFLLYGGALKDEFRGKTWDRIGSQVDIVATILRQLEIDASPFTWSKDLLTAGGPEFAYYEIGDGVGWVTRAGSLVYDFEERTMRQSTFTPQEELTARRHALAYLQVLFQSFIDL